MIELLQFRHSPYNEKVRWALDLKQLAHTRRSLLPGPHLRIVRALTGRTTTPVLLAGDRVLDGSAAIVEWLDARYPRPPLYPADRALRAEALRIQAWFDEDITPRLRRAVLDALLRSPRMFAAVFGEGRSAAARFGYSLLVPFAAPLVRRGNGITGAASVADGVRAAEEAFAFVAQRAAANGFLVGDQLSIADITAASCLATVVRPENSPMRAPPRVAPAFAALIARFAPLPGAQWVREIYAAHRGASADFDGPSGTAH
jgi:glutathione S-transferase